MRSRTSNGASKKA